MADRTPREGETDPLDDRVRATFAAEHADIERRHAAAGAVPAISSSRGWLPFAVAAAVVAVVALAGIAILGGGDDRAVEVDVAAPPTEVPDQPTTAPIASATAVPSTPDPAPAPTPPLPATAPNECGRALPRTPHFVWDVEVDDPDGGLIAHTAAGVDEPVTRVLRYNAVVTPTGGCTVTANGSLWYELVGDPASGNDWVNARYLRAGEPACVGDGRVPAENDPTELVRVSDGPLDGVAVFADDRVAFAMAGAGSYQRHGSDRVAPGMCTRGTPTPPEGCAGDRPCVDDGPTDLESLPCTRSSGSGALPQQISAGDSASSADHVHDITAESNGVCTRLVVTFGEGANEAEEEAAALPPVAVDRLLGSVTVRPDGWQLESAFDDPMRVDYGDGIGLLALSFGYEFSVEFMHPQAEPHVRFFENPARVVIDLFPSESEASISDRPFGERFVLRRPIQTDLDGPGIPVAQPIVVSGFGRPFEAAGLYRIWSVPDDVDVDAFLADPGEPLHEDFFPTGGWAEGWGEFDVTLPDLVPGSYIAVFGELPPTDEIGFYGAGQLFRVTDNPTAPGPFPEAVLLPDVQLDP